MEGAERVAVAPGVDTVEAAKFEWNVWNATSTIAVFKRDGKNQFRFR